MDSLEIAKLNLLEDNYNAELITKEQVNLSSLNLKHSPAKNSVFLLRNCFSSQECAILIEKAEKEGFTKVPVNLGGSDVVMEDIRSGSRFILDDPDFTDTLWNRIKSFMPSVLKGAKVIGLNERLRFLRYHPGDKFAPHYDGSYAREDNPLEISLLTLQMYMNSDFCGGETTFYGDDDGDDNARRVKVVPEMGSILVFEQDLMHEGSILRNGVKYTVRTDAMYSYRG